MRNRWIAAAVLLLLALSPLMLNAATTWRLPVQGNPGVGDVVYGRDANALTSLASVAAGSVLASNGVGAAPVWSAGPALTSATIGASGTSITQIRVYASSLTPAASSAAIQTTEQTFTVTGLATTDKVYVNGPAPTSLCPPTTFRVSAANTLAIGFTTLTASACTPASGTYNIVAIRS